MSRKTKRDEREQWFDGTAARRQRRILGLDIDAVAKKVGKSRWSLYRYEQNAANPPGETYLALTKVLRLKRGDLHRDKSKGTS